TCSASTRLTRADTSATPGNQLDHGHRSHWLRYGPTAPTCVFRGALGAPPTTKWDQGGPSLRRPLARKRRPQLCLVEVSAELPARHAVGLALVLLSHRFCERTQYIKGVIGTARTPVGDVQARTRL